MKAKRKKRKMFKSKKGFSLVELLAVIIIVGVIALVAISGVSRYVARSRKEHQDQNKKNVAMAAELYTQHNRSRLPKLIGDASIIPVTELRESNYLKEDIKNTRGEDCMEKSFVRIYKLSDDEYSYTTYLYCGNEKVPPEPDIPTPVVLDFKFTGGNKTNGKFNDVKDAKFSFKMKGAEDDDTIGIYSYNYVIFVRTTATGPYTEVFNSGNLKGGLEPTIGVTSQKLSSYMSLTGYTSVRIDVMVINEQGGKLDYTTSTGDYEDNEKPECGTITGQARDDNDWINKVTFGAGGSVPEGQTRSYPGRVSVNCTDGLGSGCKRDKFTRSWPNNSAGVDLTDYKLGARWSYVTLEDNAVDTNSTKCYVRANVDVQAPKIEIRAYRARDKALLKTFIVQDSTTINEIMPEGTLTADGYEYVQGTGSEKWMNLENFGTTGIYYNVSVSDNLYLYSYEWKVNNPYIAGGTADKNVASSASTGNVAGEGTTTAATGYFDNSNITDNPTNDNELKTAEHGALTGTINDLKLVREGKRYASLKVCDKAGNCSTANIYANIDITPPQVPRTSYVTVNTNSLYIPGNASNFNDHEHWSKEFVRPYVDGQREDQETQNTSIKVTLSGWDHFVYSYRKQNGRNASNAITWANPVTQNIKRPIEGTTLYGFTINDQGTHRVSFKSCDKAGNCSEYSVEDYPKIDTIKPTCGVETKYEENGTDITATAKATGSTNGSGWLKIGQQVTLSHSCADENAIYSSGCNDGDFHNQQTYLFNSDINTTKAGANGYNSTYGPNDNTAGGHVIDYAGNLSNECPKMTVKVDHIKPTCETDISWPEGNPLRPTQAGKPETGWLGLVGGTGPEKKTAKVSKVCSDPKSNNSSLMSNVSSSCDNDGTYDPVGYNKQFKIYNYEMEIYNRAGAIDIDDGGLIIDIAGNTNDCPHDRTVKIDYTPPVCTTKIDFGTGQNAGSYSKVNADPRSKYGWLGWVYNTNTTKKMARVTQVCEDTGDIQSACYGKMKFKVYDYELNTQKAGAVDVNDNGFIEDTAGNLTDCSTDGNWRTVKIDYTRPVCEVKTKVVGSYTASNGTTYNWNNGKTGDNNYTDGHWVGSGATVTINSTCTSAEPANTPEEGSIISGCNTDESKDYTQEIKTTAATTAGDGQDFWVYDKADNRSAAACEKKTVQIDLSAPTCTTESRYGKNSVDINSAEYDGNTTGYNGWLDGSYRVLVRSQCTGDTLKNGKTGSGCSETEIHHNTYQAPSGNILNATKGAATDGSGYVIYDAVGNSKTCGKKRIRLDDQVPKCTLKATSNPGNVSYSGAWTNTDSVTIARVCSDYSGSGCNTASSAEQSHAYSVENEQYWSTTTAGAISEGNSGSVTDNVGNTTVCPANKTVKLDKTKPTCTITDSHANGVWTNSNAVIQGHCSDTGSGCRTTSSDLKVTFSSDTNQDYTYSKTLTDKAGNTNTCSQYYPSIKVQKTKPTCIVHKDNHGLWSTGGVPVSVICENAGSSAAPLNKCTPTNYKISDSQWIGGETTKNSPKVTYTVGDVAGNTNTCSAQIKKKTQNTTQTCTTCDDCSQAGCKTREYCYVCSSGTHYTAGGSHFCCVGKLSDDNETDCALSGGGWCSGLKRCGKSISMASYGQYSSCDCAEYNRKCSKCGCESGLSAETDWFDGSTTAGWHDNVYYRIRTVYS